MFYLNFTIFNMDKYSLKAKMYVFIYYNLDE